ncbi:MAG: glucose 1-dehydrogenase [Haliscomenobacter sp.]|nr:glucose 1-dehydrogenase [Haliscomenobacter sp.]MBK7474482.1 glucose 1-dehydrogenase [Haliscomenobacter sp.]MBK8879095.1 glucose 1-dehydrogenase [Haliscomenobacter sp.]
MTKDLFSLQGKVAIITGASKGIGEAIAREFGRAGAQVVLSSRKQETLDSLAASLAKEGIEALAVAANVSKMDEIHHLTEACLAHFGGVDILVNNAAANPVFGPVEQTEAWAFDKIMDANLKGPFELSKRCLPSMKTRGGGSVINISSIGGLRPEPMLGIYSVSKAALISLTKVLAKEWGAYGIRVNAICPGLIKTKFSEALWGNEAILNHMMGQLPIARVGTPEEIAALALFLAAEASAYSTGSVFTADGGYTI